MLGENPKLSPNKNPELFQSLFCWIMLGESRRPCGRPRSYSVSILVLLDHARGVLPGCQVATKGTGFNPCSVGSCSGRRQLLVAVSALQRVSILVLLDHARGAPGRGVNNCFQVVSILVLLDHARGVSLLFRAKGKLIVSILVLLDHARGEQI